MSFTYEPGTVSGNVRLLVADTDPCAQIWQDDEIMAALQIESSQGLYVSGPGAFGTATFPVVPQVYSVYLAAALLYDSLAGNYGRLGEVIQLLDVKLSDRQLSGELRSIAKGWREIEANRGSFAIAEMVVDQFSFRERFQASWMRQGR